MTVTVNGAKREIAPGTTISALIEELGMGRAAVAAEVNKTLVPKRRHAETVLAEGDSVELVSLVGGG